MLSFYLARIFCLQNGDTTIHDIGFGSDHLFGKELG